MNEPQTAPEIASGSVPPAGAPAQQHPAPTPAGNNGGATFTQEQLEAARNAAAAETRRAIAAEAAEKERKAKDAREQQERIAKGEFEAALSSVNSERDSAVQQRDAYAAALAAVVKARIESVPGDKRAAVRKLVPDTLPLDQQLTQVEAAIELVGTTAPAPRGTGSNPPRAGSSDERAQRIEENKRQIRSAYSL
jgi:outer membrane translocation and assembly module TamA